MGNRLTLLAHISPGLASGEENIATLGYHDKPLDTFVDRWKGFLQKARERS